MAAFCRTVSVIAVIYLGTGLPDILSALRSSGVQGVAAFVHLGCFLFGVLGAVALFGKRYKLFRALALWSVGLASLVYATHQYSFAFPTFFHIPITFGSSYSNGEFFQFGVDLILGALFVALWVASRKLIGSPEASSSSPETSTEEASQ